MALLFAIPVTREEFLSRAADSDWLSRDHSESLGPGTLPVDNEETPVTRYCSQVLPVLNDLLEYASEVKVEVICRATLESLRSATEKFDVVTLLAHWKGAEVISKDIVTGADKRDFAMRVKDDMTPLGQWLFRRLSEPESARVGKKAGLAQWLGLRSKSVSPQDRSVKDVLNDALSVDMPEASGAEDGIDLTIEHETTRAARRRDELDRLFDRLLNHGNRLELFDGLHSRDEVEAAIAPRFTGVLDLATCRAMVLADFLSARRRHSFRTVHLTHRLRPRWAAASVFATIHLVREKGLGYLEARLIASKWLKQQAIDSDPPQSVLDRFRFRRTT